MYLFKRILILPLLLASFQLSAAEIRDRFLPDSIERAGVVYTLSGCGLREFFFNDIYLLGMYLPVGGSDVANIRRSDTGKVFLLDVLYSGNMPEDLPNLWREPLSDQISTEFLEILQEHYEAVEYGDRVEFAYQPPLGEEIRINDVPVVREDGRELMPALIDLWLGDDPVSGNLKRLLLNGRCS